MSVYTSIQHTSIKNEEVAHLSYLPEEEEEEEKEEEEVVQ